MSDERVVRCRHDKHEYGFGVGAGTTYIQCCEACYHKVDWDLFLLFHSAATEDLILASRQADWLLSEKDHYIAELGAAIDELEAGEVMS